ncbi:MAG: hypothetical protein HOQ28_13750 [Thermoleophilia bacterium]|nr:hypothetical protein [Thermoleophilia bacterium]
MPHRLFVSFAVASLALCAATASAAGVPTVARGQALQIAFATRSHAICTPQVQYSDGTKQLGSAKRARGARLSWALLVARTAPLGAGTWSVHCGATVVHTGRFAVVAQQASGGTADVPRVVVDKQGFSQRNDTGGWFGATGSHISFGLFLRNTSTTQDAINVYVLVNMVAANGQLIASMTHNVGLIAAGQTFAYGDSMGLRSQVSVAKLELTIRIGEHQAKQTHLFPEFANVRIVPNQQDTSWVGEVDGEVLNTAQAKTLRSTHLSIVLLDASGNPVGGGSGDSFASLPSGSRMVFLASSGFDAVPAERAVTPVISAEPTYDIG